MRRQDATHPYPHSMLEMMMVANVGLYTADLALHVTTGDQSVEHPVGCELVLVSSKPLRIEFLQPLYAWCWTCQCVGMKYVGVTKAWCGGIRLDVSARSQT